MRQRWRLAPLSALLLLCGCTWGVQAVGIHASMFRAANKQEAVAESGAYVASSATVEFRGVELVRELDSGFWDLVTSLGGKLLGVGVRQPRTQEEWLQLAEEMPSLDQRLARMGRAYCEVMTEPDAACLGLLRGMEGVQ